MSKSCRLPPAAAAQPAAGCARVHPAPEAARRSECMPAEWHYEPFGCLMQSLRTGSLGRHGRPKTLRSAGGRTAGWWKRQLVPYCAPFGGGGGEGAKSDHARWVVCGSGVRQSTRHVRRRAAVGGPLGAPSDAAPSPHRTPPVRLAHRTDACPQVKGAGNPALPFRCVWFDADLRSLRALQPLLGLRSGRSGAVCIHSSLLIVCWGPLLPGLHLCSETVRAWRSSIRVPPCRCRLNQPKKCPTERHLAAEASGAKAHQSCTRLSSSYNPFRLSR